MENKAIISKLGEKKKPKGTIAVDFDGTIVTHEFPEIGKDIGAFSVLKKLQANGVKLALWTMRSGETLQKAVDFCKENGIDFDYVNENTFQKRWTSSPKLYAELYIDDAAINAPLIYDYDLSLRPFIDWKKVDEILIEKGYYKHGD